MAKKPLLIFPRPEKADKTIGTPKFGGVLHFPSKEEQMKRFGSVITELDKVLSQKSLSLQQNISGTVPEMVLVLEIAGTINNFFNAVKKTAGMEFLAEFESEIDHDDLFYQTDEKEKKLEKRLPAQLFLVMTNQKALKELKKYWDKYQKDGEYKHGTTKFRDLFKQLKDIRPYSIEDRLRDTGFKDYIIEQKKYSNENVKFEVEVFFREDYRRRQQALQEIKALLIKNKGKIVQGSETAISEIRYHAFIAEAPIEIFDDLSNNSNVTFLQCEQVIYLRPVGQIVADIPKIDKELADFKIKDVPLPKGEPVVAILDGLPLANHSYLKGRLTIDDPDNYNADYQAEERIHGTMMSSLIIHGELDDLTNQPLRNPVYVRPIMKPDEQNTFTKSRREIVPRGKLPIDIIHRAVKRMFEGEGDTSPVAAKVKIINLSVCDPVRPFHINISTWAKLLDWLSYKYQVLFIVSAGNYSEDITLKIDEIKFKALSENEKQKLIVESIVKTNPFRKILTPSESINSLTTGSSAFDKSSLPAHIGREGLLIYDHSLLTPYSRIGFGYKKSIKPDILMPGGRLPYKINISKTKNGSTQLTPQISGHPPGHRVAYPGLSGQLNKTIHSHGTSNSTALTTRLGAQLYDLLVDINKEIREELRIDESYFAVLIKALIVHGAHWGNSKTILNDILKTIDQIKATVRRNHITSYLGYGVVNPERILYCTEQRITLLGYGELEKENAHVYSLPLPYSLSKEKYWKRLTVTLAWISPLNMTSNKYRKSQLYFDSHSPSTLTKQIEIPLNLERTNVGYEISKKGTVQHDILEGEEADTFLENDVLKIKINCKEDAAGLKKEKTKYGLAVTLEVNENIQIPIYEEILQQIKQKIKIGS